MRIITVDAPSILGVTTQGIELAPEVFKKLGLLDKLNAQDGGIIKIPKYNNKRDSDTLLLNPESIRDVTLQLATKVEGIIKTNSFPLVLGGDCSILLGNLLALKRLGRYGLFFLDGHEDFYSPETSPNGEAADMDLSLATGRGPDILTNFNNLKPLVTDEDIVAFGYRDEEQARGNNSPALPPTIKSYNLREVRRLGIKNAVQSAIRYLEKDSNKFWLHFDVDVLDNDLMPAADNDVPGGLSFEEVKEILFTVISSGNVIGMNVTIFNPKLDSDGSLAKEIVDIITYSLRGIK